MADSKTTALTEITNPALTDLACIATDPGGTPVSKKATVGNLIYTSIQASQLCNEIKGWPPVVNTGDLDALNLWWDKVGTPTTAPSVVALSGEAGITETWELALKCVTDAGGEGLSQTWTYADEPRVKAGRKLSVILAIWSVSSASITAKLVNSDASNTAASAVTAAAWTIVTVENHTLAGTSCSLQVTTGAAGTFYVVPLGANIGAKAIPLRPRGLRYVDVASALVANDLDPGGAYTDLDFTSVSSPLAAMLNVVAEYTNATGAPTGLNVRRNGDTSTAFGLVLAYQMTNNTYVSGAKAVCCDDGQVIEVLGNGVAGVVEHLFLGISGWWEWE